MLALSKVFVSPDTGLAQPRDLYSISGIYADLRHDLPLVVLTFSIHTSVVTASGASPLLWVSQHVSMKILQREAEP